MVWKCVIGGPNLEWGKWYFIWDTEDKFVMLEEIGVKKKPLDGTPYKKCLTLERKCMFKELKCVLGLTCKPHDVVDFFLRAVMFHSSTLRQEWCVNGKEKTKAYWLGRFKPTWQWSYFYASISLSREEIPPTSVGIGPKFGSVESW